MASEGYPAMQIEHKINLDGFMGANAGRELQNEAREVSLVS